MWILVSLVLAVRMVCIRCVSFSCVMCVVLKISVRKKKIFYYRKWGNEYHNRKFKEKAENVGLVISKDPRIGWSLTEPSEELIEYIISQGWTDILINRQESIRIGGVSGGSSGDSSGNKPPRKPSSTRKYICPCCGNSVRATKEINIICGDCMKQMVKEE